MPHLFNRDKKGRLTIVDPNRPDNNISGGSSEIERVFRCFSRAHQVLQNRMADYSSFDPSSGRAFSFLEDIIGGDFEAYRVQREVLSRLHAGQAGPAPAVVPPPPPPISQEPLPPPPPPPPSNSHVTTKKHKANQATQGSRSVGSPFHSGRSDLLTPRRTERAPMKLDRHPRPAPKEQRRLRGERHD